MLSAEEGKEESRKGKRRHKRAVTINEKCLVLKNEQGRGKVRN